MGLLHRIIEIYQLIVLAAVILSWVQLSPDNPLVRFVAAATEPVLRPIRQVLPAIGGFDFSPLVLLLGLQLIRRLL